MEQEREREKERLLGHMRAEAPEELLPWFDAAVLLGSDKLHYPPLLGTGGNDGRPDFTNNFSVNDTFEISYFYSAPQNGSFEINVKNEVTGGITGYAINRRRWEEREG